MCQRGASGALSNTPCIFVRDERSYDWNGVAVVVNRDIICPLRTSPDSVAKVASERLRRIRPESILTVAIVQVVPDSIQRGCAEPIRKVIYLVTK